MEANFVKEWEHLGRMAFRRHERIGPLFKNVSRLLKTCARHPDIWCLLVIKNWLLVPFTMWPIDFAGLGLHVCKRLSSGKRVDTDVTFVLEELLNVPTEKARASIEQYELLVEQGTYEPLLRAAAKYDTHEQELLGNRILKKEWLTLKRMFRVRKFRSGRKGVIRRRMVQERNFRSDWEYKRRTEKDRFQTAFDAFCYRWNLYGMESDKPLPLKLSVNPTVHGLMIVIPSYWSLDSKRDLHWGKINRLHKARGALRQGMKMSQCRLERHTQAQTAFEADQRAKELGYRGQTRMQFIISEVQLLEATDARIIRRLISEGAMLTAQGTQKVPRTRS